MWFSSSAGVSTSLSSMKSTSSASSTSASAKCPMRTLAITGIVTVAMISRITLIDAMRATPPSLRISEGTRSNAITAHAPAFSAMLACSAFVTSMITPPLSISARPTFTRHSFDPLLPAPLPFTFFASIFHLLSLLELLDGLCPSNLFHSIITNRALLLASTKPAASRIAGHKNVSSLPFRLAPLHNNFILHIHRLQVLDRQFRRHCLSLTKPTNLGHRLIQERGDNSSMHKSPATLVPLTQNKPSDNPPIHVVLLERQLHPAGIVPAAAKALVHRIRRQHNHFAQFLVHRPSLIRFLSALFLQTSATRLRSALRTPRCRLRISIFSNSANVATPRAICFSSRLANPSRSVFGCGPCT